MPDDRIYLSPPYLTPADHQAVSDALASNWIAPVGPHLEAFERAVAERVGVRHAVALTSGTAALHLAVRLAGVGPGDEVFVSDFTFCASVNPILYEGGTPVFVDAERASWNMDPALVEQELRARAASGKRQPKALIVAHIYGQSADLGPLVSLCDEYGVTLIEDAAESLGATYQGRSVGAYGKAGIFSFNGNKIITTSGGGMLVTDDEAWAQRARKLATQAREPVSHYEHHEVGYNYRMSNVLAALGNAQLAQLDDRLRARRRVFEAYRAQLDPAVCTVMPTAGWGRPTHWVTCVTIDPRFGDASPARVIAALAREHIEARHLWKPMRHQRAYAAYSSLGAGVSAELFARGVSLPSGTTLRADQVKRIAAVVHDTLGTSA